MDNATHIRQICGVYRCFMSTFMDNVGMTKEKAIQLAGSQAKLARILGVDRRVVWNWKKIPQGRIFQLMVLRPEWFKVIE